MRLRAFVVIAAWLCAGVTTASAQRVSLPAGETVAIPVHELSGAQA